MPAKDHRSYEERFWSKTNKQGPVLLEALGPCWIWTAALTDKGYGLFKNRGIKEYRANRIAWSLTYGNIPPKIHVCHKCDNPPCCNPDHLFLGTNLENRLDSILKNRFAMGSRHGNAKLTEHDIIDIRTLCLFGATHTELAKQYDVSNATVHDLIAKRTWKHVV